MNENEHVIKFKKRPETHYIDWSFIKKIVIHTDDEKLEVDPNTFIRKLRALFEAKDE